MQKSNVFWSDPEEQVAPTLIYSSVQLPFTIPGADSMQYMLLKLVLPKSIVSVGDQSECLQERRMQLPSLLKLKSS